MILFDVLMDSGRLDAVCSRCGAHTQLDARIFARRRGLNTPLERLGAALACAGCGARGVMMGSAAAEPPLRLAGDDQPRLGA